MDEYDEYDDEEVDDDDDDGSLYQQELYELSEDANLEVATTDSNSVLSNKFTVKKVSRFYKTQVNPRKGMNSIEEFNKRFSEFEALIDKNSKVQKLVKDLEQLQTQLDKDSIGKNAFKFQTDNIFRIFIHLGMTERQGRSIFRIGHTRFDRLQSNSAPEPRKKKSSRSYSDSVIADLDIFVKTLALEPGFACQHKEHQLWYLEAIKDWAVLYQAYQDWCTLQASCFSLFSFLIL